MTFEFTTKRARASSSFQSVVVQNILPTFYREMYKCCSENLVVQSVFHLSKLWKTKFLLLCDVILLVRLEEKFGIDYSWQWMGENDSARSLAQDRSPHPYLAGLVTTQQPGRVHLPQTPRSQCVMKGRVELWVLLLGRVSTGAFDRHPTTSLQQQIPNSKGKRKNSQRCENTREESSNRSEGGSVAGSGNARANVTQRMLLVVARVTPWRHVTHSQPIR